MQTNPGRRPGHRWLAGKPVASRTPLLGDAPIRAWSASDRSPALPGAPATGHRHCMERQLRVICFGDSATVGSCGARDPALALGALIRPGLPATGHSMYRNTGRQALADKPPVAPARCGVSLCGCGRLACDRGAMRAGRRPSGPKDNREEEDGKGPSPGAKAPGNERTPYGRRMEFRLTRPFHGVEG